MDKINYGEYIKKRRVELNLSQSDLANVLSCSYQAISKYENNSVKVDISLISKLAKVLKVDLDSFLLKKYEKNNDYCDYFEFDYTKFLNKLNYLREKRCITQKELAKQVNISSSRISKLEKGNANLKAEEFLAFAKYFNCSYSSLYFGMSEEELEKNIVEKENLLIENKKIPFKERIKKPSIYIPLSIALVIVLALIITIPLSLFNNNSSSSYNDDFIFTSDEKGLIITDYKGENNTSITIPSSINNEKVYKIASKAFNSEDLVKEIYISEGIEEIESQAFNFLSSLKEVYLPSTLKILEDNAFNISYSLSNIYLNNGSNYFSLDEDGNLYSFDKKELYRVLPKNNYVDFNILEGVEIIKGGAFDSNYTLTNVIFPSSLKTINSFAFNDCYLINELNFNEGLETLSVNAFSGLNKSLKIINLPSTLKNMNGNPFYNYPHLKEINISSENKYFTTIDNILYSKDLSSIYTFPSLYKENSFILPEGVKNIEIFAFNNLINLESLVLPSTIELAKDRGICYNESLESILIKKGAKNFKYRSIYGCKNSDVYLEYPSLPSSFDKEFTDSEIFFEGEWDNKENIE